MLVATGFVAEEGVGAYGPTKFTEHLAHRKAEGTVKVMCVNVQENEPTHTQTDRACTRGRSFDVPLRCVANTPSYVRETGY